MVLVGHRPGIDIRLLVERPATHISPVRCLRDSDSARYRSLDSFLSQLARPFEYGMSASLGPLEAMESIPGMNARGFHIEVLSGGLTNRVFKISNKDDAYVLRLDAEHTAQLGLDRATERKILEFAYAKGLAPEIVHTDESGGVLLLRYIDGRVWTVDDLLDSEKIELLADLLRQVHALPQEEPKADKEGCGPEPLLHRCLHIHRLYGFLRSRPIRRRHPHRPNPTPSSQTNRFAHRRCA